MPKVKDLSDVSPHSHEDSFVFFDSREDNVTTSISVADIIRMREMAFDRWNWETGDEKDKALFERLDSILESLAKSPKFEADDFYMPNIPIKP